ncbi:MAG: YihY/virulence factor BrkB family protein [Glaciihabitans sp.]|nr:YihY/virulence factor BrkB family protein [Glaciihabitans sp.]
MTQSAARIPKSRRLSGEALSLATRRAYHGFLRHRGIDSAATLSFFAALALFPASLSVVSLFALLDTRTRAVADILTIVGSVAPKDTVVAIRGPLSQLVTLPNPQLALAVGIVLTLWTLSGYLAAVGRAIDLAYDVLEGRPWVLLRSTAMLISAVLMITAGVILVLLIGTPTIASAVARFLGIAPGWVTLWNIAKWPVLAALATFIVAILYYYSPNVHHLRIRWVSWGALLTIVAWILTTIGFAVYVLNVSHYNKYYGWLGGAVVLLLWLYLSNYVLVFGAEVDAEIVRVRQLESGIASEDVIQVPLRSTHRNLILARNLADDIQRGRRLRQDADEKRARDDPGKLP